MFDPPSAPEPPIGNPTFLRIGLGILAGLSILLLAVVLWVFPPGAKVRTQVLYPGDPAQESPVPSGSPDSSVLPGGEPLVRCTPTDEGEDNFGRAQTGSVAGARIAQAPIAPPLEEGGGQQPPLPRRRPPSPLFRHFRDQQGGDGTCFANAIGQRLYMTRVLDITNEQALTPRQVGEVAWAIVQASAVLRPPEGSIRVPRVSLYQVLSRVQLWPPRDEGVWPEHRAPIETMGMDEVGRILQANAEQRGGAAVYSIEPQYEYYNDNVLQTVGHGVVIYEEEGGFRVVDEGHVSALGTLVSQGKRWFCWEQPRYRGAARTGTVQSCVLKLPEHLSKKFEVNPTPPPPPP